MKIKTTITEIECTAEELRQSNSLADSFTGMLRNLFNGTLNDDEDDETPITEKVTEVG